MKSPRVTLVAVLILLAAAVLFGHLTTKPLDLSPPRIVALELAPTVEKANEFLQAWSTARPQKWQDILRESLKWDTGFILSYAPLNALLCWLAAAQLSRRMPRLSAFARVIAWAQLLAGVLDFVENHAMLQMIDAGAAHNPYPQISFAAAGTKFLLIAAYLALGITAVVDRFRHSE